MGMGCVHAGLWSLSNTTRTGRLGYMWSLGYAGCLTRTFDTQASHLSGGPCGYHHVHLALGQTSQDFPWGLEHRKSNSRELS